MSEATVPAPALSKTWRVEKKHTGSFTGGKVALSQNEKFLACWCSEDVAILDIDSGQTLMRVEAGEDDGFTTFALAPNDGEVLTANTRSHLIKRWNLDEVMEKGDEAKEVRGWRGHDLPILDMVYSPSGKFAATASTDRTVRVWDVAGAFCTHAFRGHKSIVTRVFFHPDPQALQVISCAEDGEIRVWDMKTTTPTTTPHNNKKQTPTAKNITGRVLANHMSQATDVAFSSDGSVMVSCGRDKVVNLWNMKTYTLMHTIPVLEELESVVMLPAGSAVPGVEKKKAAKDEYFVVGGEQGVLRVYSLKTRQCVYDYSLPQTLPHKDSAQVKTAANAIVRIIVAAESGRLIVATQEHNIYIYDIATFTKHKLIIGFNDDIVDVRCMPDGQRALVATNSAQVRLFDLDTFDADLLTGHTDIVLSVDVSADGRFVVTSSKDNTVRFWSLLPTPRCVAVCEGHSEAVGAVRFSRLMPSAKNSLFAVSGSRDRTLKLWNAQNLLSLSSASASKSDADEKSSLVPIPVVVSKFAHEKDINTLAVAPNDKLIASGGQDKSIRVWSASDLSLVATLQGHRRGVWSVEFSSVDRVLASASADKTIRLWSMTDYSCLKTFEGHAQSVLKVLFVNNGMQLLSAGSDAVVKLWTIKTNECVNTFDEQHSAKIWSMCLTKDDKKLVTGGADSVLNVWKDVTADEKAEESEKAKSRLLKEQSLSNHLRRKNYTQAVSLAFELEQPRRLLGIFTTVSEAEMSHEAAIKQRKLRRKQKEKEEKKQEESEEEESDEEDEITRLQDLVQGFTPEHLRLCLLYIRDWNANAKHCHIAHKLMGCIFRHFPPATLKTVPGIADVLNAVALYSERHFSRIDRLLQKSFLLDYTLQSMMQLTAQEAEAGEQEEDEEESEEEDETEDVELDADTAKMVAMLSSSSNRPPQPNGSHILGLKHLEALSAVPMEADDDSDGDDDELESNWD